MEIEIYADVVCPWCYLGKRRLEAALATVEPEPILRWRALPLDPTGPRPSQPLLAWLAGRYGSVDRARQAMVYVTTIAHGDGLSFDLDHAIMADTFAAHRLLWFADQPEAVVFGAGPDTQPELAEALHRAHLVEGRDIGSPLVLVDVADEVGLEPDRVWQLLDSTEGTADVRAQIAKAHDVGISCVPTFVFAGKYALTGARSVEAIRAMLLDVIGREGMAPTLTSLIPRQAGAATAEDDSRVH